MRTLIKRPVFVFISLSSEANNMPPVVLVFEVASPRGGQDVGWLCSCGSFCGGVNCTACVCSLLRQSLEYLSAIFCQRFADILTG
jgi:hypothetical protein